jgi:hypothetical protein
LRPCQQAQLLLLLLLLVLLLEVLLLLVLLVLRLLLLLWGVYCLRAVVVIERGPSWCCIRTCRHMHIEQAT